MDVMTSLLQEGKGFLDELERLKVSRDAVPKSKLRKRKRAKIPY